MSEDAERRLSYTEEPEASHQDPNKNKPGAKPRASRAGTRSVTTLNAEQLARKRANDREAQRAIRQRTREHIERLENRIRELSENNPESDAAFEAVQRRNSELEEELRQLRKTLYGLGDGSNSPGGSQPHVGYTTNPSVKLESVSYPAQWGSQNVHVGPAGYAPTSNPMPESEHPWQPQLSTHHNQRRSHNQHHPGLVQPISWSRNDSVDSDYDSTYGLDQEPVGIDHPVGVHPEQMQNFYTNPSHQMESQVPHHGQHEVMWQHPSSGPVSIGPYDGPPHMGARDPSTYGMSTPFVSQPSTPGWGSPHPQSTDRDAYF